MGEKIHRFRIHGINTVVENPDRLTEETLRTSYGNPRWRQRAGTDNWFHLAIPTPMKITDKAIHHLFQIQLHVQRDDGVEIERIHIRTGPGDPDGSPEDSITPAIPANEPYLFEYGNHTHQLRLPVAALCLSVRVMWHNSDSYFRLYEAAAGWMEE